MSAAISDADQFASLMRTIAGPRMSGEKEAHPIYRGGAPFGFSRRQSHRYWYRQVANIPFSLMAKAIEAAAAAEQKRAERAARVAVGADRRTEEARNEYAALVERIARVEAALRIRDEDFHSPDVDALREMARRGGRTVD